MNKIVSTLLIIFFSISITQAEEIINSAFVTYGVLNLGEEAQIQFNVNQVTVCDSYSISTKIDYTTKKIVVEVNYNYISNCSESHSIITKFVNKQILLEGIYSVEIKLNVPSNLIWNKTFYLPSISVNKPFNLSCSNSYIPPLQNPCPLLINPVCACDGQNYNNECDAYLFNRNGIYNKPSCGVFIEQESLPFKCGKFQNFISNRFSKYSCTNDNFEGAELYFKYEHIENDSLIIDFISNNESTRLFLTKLENDNIVCISMSDKNRLEYADLPIGTYYIIADSKQHFNLEIEFCIKTSINEKILDNNLTIYPIPIINYIGIKSNNEIKRIKIYNLWGEEIFNNKVNSSDIKINNILKPGIYLIQVETNIGIKTKKIIIN